MNALIVIGFILTMGLTGVTGYILIQNTHVEETYDKTSTSGSITLNIIGSKILYKINETDFNSYAVEFQVKLTSASTLTITTPTTSLLEIEVLNNPNWVFTFAAGEAITDHSIKPGDTFLTISGDFYPITPNQEPIPECNKYPESEDPNYDPMIPDCDKLTPQSSSEFIIPDFPSQITVKALINFLDMLNGINVNSVPFLMNF